MTPGDEPIPDFSAPLWVPGNSPVGLYVHVPFCRSICTYCAFAKGEYTKAGADSWLDGVEREVAFRRTTTWKGRPELDSVFLGGGTPSALEPGQLRRLGTILEDGFEVLPEAEFTSEANPESFLPEVADALVAIGVNRVSLGVQSLNAAELDLLGRIHGETEVFRAVAAARTAGIENINLDLMYGLPGQTLPVFQRSLDSVLEREPEHVSAYCLGLEPGTPMATDVETGTLTRPEDGPARAMYDHLVARMGSAGYTHYEISNFAKKGRACRHNLRYWRRQDFLAIGPSAHGLLAGHRWTNPAPVDRWITAYRDPGAAPRPAPVPSGDARFEWMFLNLRLMEGISEDDFANSWGLSLDAAYGEVVSRLEADGLLLRKDGRVALTPKAYFLSDGVFAEFAR